MATTADTAHDHDEQLQPDGDQPASTHAAESAQEQHQTPGDQPGARPTQQPDKGGDDGDDLLVENDPITQLKKQFVRDEATAEPATPATTPPAKTDDDEPPAPKADDAKKPDDAGETKKTEDEVLERLASEDWGKLSHKGKTQFLQQQREIRNLRTERQRIEQDAKKARADSDAVEAFVRKLELSNDEYANGLTTVAQVKRGDAAAIPLLEKTLADLYQRTGRKPPAPAAQHQAAPAIRPWQGDLPKEYVELGQVLEIPESRLRMLAALEFADRLAQQQGTAAPPAPAAPPAATPPATPVPAQPAAPAPAAAQREVEDTVHENIFVYLESQGITRDRAIAYVSELMPQIPAAQRGLATRFRAVMDAHEQRVRASPAPGQQQPQQRRQTGTPVSSRTAPPARGGSTTPSADPLDALKRQWVR